ncbi:hypothetical protein MJH12_07735, partial [bacterium]|nr:hypothetical protein [bacterium]
LKASCLSLPSIIEYPIKNGDFPTDQSQYFPAILRKYPLLNKEDIIFYKFYQKVDIAKLLNFKFIDNKLLLKLDFSIVKSKLANLVFFIDKRKKVTRFITA